MDELIDPAVERYIDDFTHAQHDDPVLDEMEQRARRLDFPIVGRSVGRLLELAARSVGARRVLELGSGFGYSAYWFARAVGEGGEVICTDRSEDNATEAERFLVHAGLWERVRFEVRDAGEVLEGSSGEFDVVFVDADKEDYPRLWRAASGRIRVGGLYLCDNTLWGGRVVTGEEREGLPGTTEAIIEHNRLIAEDRRYVSSIVPIRDGVLIATRVA